MPRSRSRRLRAGRRRRARPANSRALAAARGHLDVIGHHQHRAARSLGRRGAGHRVLDGQALPPAPSRATRPPAGRGRARACRGHLVTAHRCRKVVVPMLFRARSVSSRCVLVTSAIGIPSAASASSSSRAPGTTAARLEELPGVVVQPAVGLGHRARIVSSRGRRRRCSMVSSAEPPTMDSRTCGVSPAETARRARPARRPRAFRSRRACRPCPRGRPS